MNLTKLTGTITAIQRSSETSGQMNKGTGGIHTKQVLSFRIDGKSALIKLPAMPDVNEGESITIAGHEKNGIFEAFAMRNNNSGAIYAVPTTMMFVVCGLLALVGLMTLVMLVGVIFLALAGLNLWIALRYKKAAEMVAA